ncbi:DUF2306 domain-containing protein [Salegentibacter sp. LM13S]|uniref:DUF2306 domain-containing protein n=1 Tax=Salegentibacter lacus TaxID=2873599 RepID=UPI001CCE394F|nr:DUF2306 domain-containing protein [Salegentibacter lacus]MBZ9631903.1 DUF2306 domain-containing protein [Salegentibacter lacus]
MKKASWVIIGLLSIIIGLYPVIYLFIDRKFGLLGTKSVELLSNNVWNIMFYAHIFLGGLALLIGWLQFSKKLRNKYMTLHRRIGETYIISVLISGICGLYIAFFSTGGATSVFGFGSLALIWLISTFLAYKSIRNGKIRLHENLMIYSYAACFAAVTLRIWLPLLTIVLNDFIFAYRIVAWLCWVPNLFVAYLIIKNKSQLPTIYKNNA